MPSYMNRGKYNNNNDILQLCKKMNQIKKNKMKQYLTFNIFNSSNSLFKYRLVKNSKI